MDIRPLFSGEVRGQRPSSGFGRWCFGLHGIAPAARLGHKPVAKVSYSFPLGIREGDKLAPVADGHLVPDEGPCLQRRRVGVRDLKLKLHYAPSGDRLGQDHGDSGLGNDDATPGKLLLLLGTNSDGQICVVAREPTPFGGSNRWLAGGWLPEHGQQTGTPAPWAGLSLGLFAGSSAFIALRVPDIFPLRAHDGSEAVRATCGKSAMLDSKAPKAQRQGVLQPIR